MAFKFKINIISIISWVLVVVLLVGVGALGVLNQHQAKKTAGLSEAFLQVGTAAGVEGLAPESLTDATKLPEVVQQIQKVMEEMKADLEMTSASLTTAQSDVSNAKAEMASQVQAQAAKAEALTKEQAEKAEAAAAAAAKELAEKSEALAAAEKQKAEVEASLETLKAQMAADAARLQGELDAAKQAAIQLEAVAPATEASAMEEPTMAGDLEEEVEEVAPPEEEGRLVGQSEMFSMVRYSGADKTLFFRLLDKQTLTYRDVPPEAYGNLVEAGDMLDMRYRFKIQGTYKSIPPDSVVIRKYWKWHRRHKPMGEVRTVEVGAPSASTGN